jgi:hypothetical protein
MHWHSVNFNDHVTIENKMPVRLNKTTSNHVVSNRIGEAQFLAIIEDPCNDRM